MPRILMCVAGLACPMLLAFQLHAQTSTELRDSRPLLLRSLHAEHACDDITGCGKGEFYRSLAAAAIEDEDPFGTCLAREAQSDTDLLHCDLDIEIILSPATIIGSNTFTLMSSVDDLTEFTFRLRNNYTITSAILNGTTPVAVASPSTTTRIATLDRPYDTGEVFTLRIEYAGPPVSRGFGSINFTTSSGNPVVATLSEPYFAYTWWPCKDGDFGLGGDTSDKFTLDIAITAPDQMRSVANGVLQGIDELSGGRRRHRWSSNYPIATYLVAFASTVYNTHTYDYQHSGGTMPVELNLYPSEDTAVNRAAWARSVDMLEVFRPIYGLYPFIDEKYGIYNFPFNGGMEHQTNSGQGGYSESLTAHELAHQWWGDDVTTRTWHDIWLNEGFATYGEALWAERKPGSSGVPALHAAMAARRPTSVNGTVYVSDVSDMNRIFSSNFSYRKGAWVLHQLRKVVGDETFFDTLAAYRALYSGSSATTADFVAVASATFGEDLDWFFQQWVFTPGAPAYAFGSDSVTIAGQEYLRLHIRQVQQGSYGLYRMPIDLRIDSAQGSQTRTIWNWASRQHYLIPVESPPTGLALDEFNWILATAKNIEPYQNGPPKLVQLSPAPGEQVEPSSIPASIVITFSEPVVASAADFIISAGAGPIPFDFSYLAPAMQAVLTPVGGLEPGVYTVRVRESIVSVAAGLALDGGMTDPASAASLPSGNGLPGGDAIYTFEVLGNHCYANCDQSTSPPLLNVDDFTCFINEYAAAQALPAAQQIEHYANCDGSSSMPVLNVDDFTCFINHYAAGCP